MKMDLQLINAPLPSDAVCCRRTKAYVPLALLCLATHIQHHSPHLNIEVIDGEITSVEDIIQRTCASIVGISSTSFSYSSAVKIAQSIKSRNPETKIILGGTHASQMPRKILANRSCFDFVVEGQGELPLLSLLKGKEIRSIENCWYKNSDSGEIHHNRQIFTPINDLFFPNYNIVDLQPYFSNFSLRYRSKSFRKGVPIISSTGCKWRMQSGGCIFCSIPNSRVSLLTPSKFWNLVNIVYESTGADFLWDVSDTFTAFPEWISALVELRPHRLPVAFHVYGRPQDITPRLAESLVELGVEEILLGVESFDDHILKLINKGTTKDGILQSLDVLHKYNIKVAISLALGLPEESEASLRKTFETCLKLTDYNNILEFHTGILIPTPGSELFTKMLKNSKLEIQYGSLDILPYEKLMHDYIMTFTNCNPDLIYDYYARIDALFPSAGPFYITKKTSLHTNISYSDEILPKELRNEA